MLILDSGEGQWYALNSTAGDLWRAWARGADLDAAVAEACAQHAWADEGEVRRDGEALFAELLERGLLVDGRARRARRTDIDTQCPGGPAFAGTALPCCARPPRSPLLDLAAYPVLLLSVVLTRISFHRTGTVIRAVRRLRPAATADPGRALRVVASVGRAARRYPGRAACLERSAAASILGALAGQELAWCLGAATDPYRFHAWVEADRCAVLDPHEPADAQRYLRVLSV
ncbi:lasso peptide biosynthesis B2 protein [Actinospica durhamensis]|uniref:Lasso peptide biosynthesis B2 protein n=1 Tax=Actinospica durhamensis TaxID=1508375 RepID=A0A941ELX0_9ACTN|nr:lasso peptide biosynthesis B2 protein [Actinospica durhamensis]MBR7832957.1 lasso peptide biosynthesis B2 protein [Actinospica durhamensis]